MKKISILILIGVLLFVNACKKDTPEEPVTPKPEVPELNIKATPNPVFEGNDVLIKVTSKHMDSVFMNGVKLPWLSGNITITHIMNDTIIVIDGYSTSIVTGGTKADVETVKKTTMTEKISVIHPTVKIAKIDITPDTGFINKIYPDETDGNYEVIIGGQTHFVVWAVNVDSIKTDCPSVPDGFVWDLRNDSIRQAGFLTPLLDHDTVYHFWAYGNGQVVIDSIVIKVPVYNLTEIETLLVGKKRYLAREWLKARSGDNWQEMSLSEDSKGFAYIFFPNHWTQSYFTTNGHEEFYGRGEWSIYGNDTMIGGLNYAPCHIEELNDSTFLYWTRIWCFECEVDSTFHRYEYKIH